MSGEDSYAVLAEEIARLKEQIRGAYGKIAVADKAITTLSARLTDALDNAPIGPAAPYWVIGDKDEHDGQLAELEDWVVGVLLREYPGYFTHDWFCKSWPVHREAVWELGNLRGLWRIAYDRPVPLLMEAGVWHDRWVPGVIARLKTVMQPNHNGSNGCAAARLRR